LDFLRHTHATMFLESDADSADYKGIQV